MSGPDRARLPVQDARSSAGKFLVISLRESKKEQQIRAYKRRRPHLKSRGGCQGCKQRRVKCDEATPVCLRCRRHTRPCVYGDGRDEGEESEGAASGGQLEEQKFRNLTTNARPSALPVKRKHEHNPLRATKPRASASHALAKLPIPNTSLPKPRFLRVMPMPVSTLEYGTPSNQLLHHFDVAGDSIFDMPNYIGPLIPLALQFPHMRGTMHAVAASHLSHKAPGIPDYRIANYYQQNVALKAYQTALNTPFKAQGQLGVDALLVTAILMNMLVFIMPMETGDSSIVWDSRQPGPPPPCADPDPNPRRSWVFSTHESRLDWLALGMGLTPLLIATAPWREKSRLRLFFANSDDEPRTLSGSWQSLSRVPPAWLKIFGFNAKSRTHPGFRGNGVITPAPVTPGGSPSTAASSPDSATTETISEADRIFRAPLRIVAELRLIKANDRNLIQYFQLMGQLHNDFRHKLLERDEKALWLFGMWMGLICRFTNVWWTRRRTRCDFRAIRLWLHLVGVGQRPGEEGQIWRALLQDLDDTWGYDFETDPIMHRALAYKFG